MRVDTCAHNIHERYTLSCRVCVCVCVRVCHAPARACVRVPCTYACLGACAVHVRVLGCVCRARTRAWVRVPCTCASLGAYAMHVRVLGCVCHARARAWVRVLCSCACAMHVRVLGCVCVDSPANAQRTYIQNTKPNGQAHVRSVILEMNGQTRHPVTQSLRALLAQEVRN
jgi:hypothetical protein